MAHVVMCGELGGMNQNTLDISHQFPYFFMTFACFHDFMPSPATINIFQCGQSVSLPFEVPESKLLFEINEAGCFILSLLISSHF